MGTPVKLGHWIVLLVIVAAIGGAVYYFKLRASPHAFVGNCYADGGIEQDQRAAIEAVARRFLIDLRDEAPGAVRRTLSSKGQAATSEAQLQQAQNLLRSAQPAFQVQQTFYQEMTLGRATDGAMTPCEGAMIALSDRGATGHVLLTSAVPGGALTADVWLAYEPEGWKVRGMQIRQSAVGDNDGGHVWQMARAQRQAGHALMAAILYAVAEGLLDRGRFFQSRAFADFRRDAASFTRPPELEGAPPYAWRFGADVFTVTLVNYAGTVDGHVVLDIHQRLPSWPDEAGADARNRALIDALNAAHPEWRQIADTLAARTEMDAEGRLFGTTYDRQTGYGEAPVAPSASAPRIPATPAAP